MSVKLFDLQTGKEIIVKWFDKNHVQFEGGHSCSRKDIHRFYGNGAEVMLKNVQSIVDNYLVDQKKFDYPGKPDHKKKKQQKAEKKIANTAFDADCDKLCTYQPPESLTQDLLHHGAGVWIQKANHPLNVPPKHDLHAPWVWRWGENIKIYRSVPHAKIKEWLDICIIYLAQTKHLENQNVEASQN